MRRRTLSTVAVVAIATLTYGVGSSAAKGKRMTLTCTIEAFQQGLPDPSAIHLGFVKCPKPLGHGLHYNAFTVTTTPAAGAPGAAEGRFVNYYDRGTTRGTFRLAIVASSPTSLTYRGTVTYSAGTGKFKHIKGVGTIVCTSSDAGARKLCTVTTTLTGL